MSCIRSHYISSVTAGIVLAYTIRADGSCAPGFVALQMLICLASFAVKCMRVCSVDIDTRMYSDHNEDFVQRCSDTAAPRQSAAGVPSVPYVFLFHVIGGLCEFISASLPASVGDGYVIMLLLGVLCGPRGRVAVVLVLFTSVLRLPLPTVFGLVRGICLVLAVVCRHVTSSYAWLHPLVASTFIMLWSGTICTNPWRAVSPAAVSI